MSEKAVESIKIGKIELKPEEALDWMVDMLLVACGSFGSTILECDNVEHIYVKMKRDPEKEYRTRVYLYFLTTDGGMVRIDEKKTIDMHKLECDYEAILKRVYDLIKNELDN